MEGRAPRPGESYLSHVTPMPLIEIQNLTKEFTEGFSVPVQALRGLSLQIDEGEFLALSGPSGSGKTTLLNLIGGLDRPSSGSVVVDGKEISNLTQQGLTRFRRDQIGFIFSDFNLIATLTAAENIEYVLWLQGVKSSARRKRVNEIAERFGIEGMLHRRPSQLSRGQQQRVAVSRAIVHSPKVVLGDELTANLDHRTGLELMSFLKELNAKQGVTFVYTTHDPSMIEQAKRVISIRDGRLIDAVAGKHS